MDFWQNKLGAPVKIVAPMVDASELAWRLLSRKFGAQLCYTPMLHAALFAKDPKYRAEALNSCPEDKPLVVQFCGNDPQIVLEAALKAQDFCSAIDLNLGCPQAIAKRGRYGAYLQDEWPRLQQMVGLLSENLKVPVTCKIRILETKEKTIEYAKMLENAGCKMLTVHGRTREQKGPLTGLADWSFIKSVRDSVKIPVIANGNIQNRQDLERCLEETGAQAVMTAEGNLYNPGIFLGLNPPCWEPALEYLQLAERYPCPNSYVRGHLFKLFHHVLSLEENNHLRIQLGAANTLTQFKTITNQIRALYENYHEGKEIWPHHSDEFDLTLPPWLCQPYVRDSPENHLKKSPTSCKRIYQDPEGNTISRKKMKKLRRILRRPEKSTEGPGRPTEKCGLCENPLVDVCNPKSCQKIDDDVGRKPVCGSDGLSYPDRCQLERVKCQNGNVTLVKRGPCKRQRSCLEWQDLSLDFPQYRFKARCKKNGAYEPGQCHPESGFCWCVTPDGVPVAGTVKERNVKVNNDSKPIRCAKKKLPRSSGGRPKSRGGAARVCKLGDKSHFNNNLINSFHSEYVREGRRSGGGGNATDQEVIAWKFRSLDVDGDQSLDRKEYRDIKRLVAKAVRPKKCARSFPKACDVDSDGRVAALEWAECLTRDGITVATTDGAAGKDDADDYDAPYDALPVPPHGVLNPDSVPPLANYDDDIPESREDEQPPGCLGDRKAALEEGGSVAGHLHDATYIPECTTDGRYKKVQCYKSVGYCWCVNEENGQNIPGTSVKGRSPDCDSFKPPPKPIKGCPDDKKVVFLKELMQFLRGKMSEGDATAGATAPIQSKEEQALWSFNFLDKNKNKILERAEWKTFKEMVAPVKGLRKCGKKLPRYCDSDKNKEISTTEWLDCLNVQGLIAISGDPRSGKTNPLSMLKDD